LWLTSANARYELLIDGAAPSSTPAINGSLDAPGRVLLGHLRVDVLNNNRFGVGDAIPLFTHPGGFTGAFNSITLPTLDGGRVFSVAVEPTRVVLRVNRGTPSCYSSDFNGNGDFGTDQNIEAFFACLAGSCCAACPVNGADFNGDGDAGTDQDIEAFFRVLSGGNC
jgi:hypothetical protein